MVNCTPALSAARGYTPCDKSLPSRRLIALRAPWPLSLHSSCYYSKRGERCAAIGGSLIFPSEPGAFNCRCLSDMDEAWEVRTRQVSEGTGHCRGARRPRSVQRPRCQGAAAVSVIHSRAEAETGSRTGVTQTDQLSDLQQRMLRSRRSF